MEISLSFVNNLKQVKILFRTSGILILIGFILALSSAVSGKIPNQKRTWIYFKDRGIQSARELQDALQREENLLLPATKKRLLKVRKANALLTEQDLPVCNAYLTQIERITGLKPHAVSRTLNAASFTLSDEQIQQIRTLPFVLEIQPVRCFAADYEIPNPGTPAKQMDRTAQDSAYYGGSYHQNIIGNFIPAHEAEYTGEGVLVGMLDSGWNNLGHVCFASLEIIATWDFVNGDSSVANDPGQMGDGSHGTKTLSCIAGFDPGNLIGTAYDVSVALAKTENTEYELPIEEDNWAAGIEWLDSLGCVVASSSLSYPDLHSYEEMDGNSTVVTIAADNAVARGIVVLNSMGNNGQLFYPDDKMGAPADGDSVLSMGMVNYDSTRAIQSSIGPTYDERIKPDLMALGVNVWVASAYSQTFYNPGTGTSFSTPVTAGACALLLQADPSLTPMEVHAILKATGDQATNPDTLRGWGIYDVWAAIQSISSAVPERKITLFPDSFQLFAPYPNPFNASAQIAFSLLSPGWISLDAYDLRGRRVAAIVTGFFPGGEHICGWNAQTLGSAVYILQLRTPWGVKTSKVLLIK